MNRITRWWNNILSSPSTIAQWEYRRRLARQQQSEDVEPLADVRLRTWRAMSLDLQTHVNPFDSLEAVGTVSQNPETDYFPEGRITVTCPKGNVELDDLAGAVQNKNLDKARGEIAELATGQRQASDHLWVWYVQAGHDYWEQGRADLALRAYLNEQRIRRVQEPESNNWVMNRNVARCLRGIGDFENAGFRHLLAAEAALDEKKEIDAAGEFECTGLSWERFARDTKDRPRVTTINATYDSTICFRKAKYLYASQGDFDGTSRCNVLERDAERRWTHSRARQYGLRVMRTLWLYGESPVRVMMAAMFVWFCSGIVYFCSGFKGDGKAIDGLKGVANALYLSIITIATVGYGDLTPTGRLARGVAGIEGVCGVLFAAMFLVAMQRRYTGR